MLLPKRSLASSPAEQVGFEIIQLAHGCGSLGEFERRTLEFLQTTIHFDAGLIHLSDGVTASAAPTCVGISPDALGDRQKVVVYERELAPVLRAAELGNGVAVDTEILGPAVVRTCSYFREIVAVHRGQHSLWAISRLRGRVVGKVMLGRCREGFRAEEKQTLSRLLPAIAICAASFEQLEFQADEPAQRVDLSPREVEILTYLQMGYTNAEIGKACGTSPNTVRNQLVRVFRKIGATTRAEAVGLSLRLTGTWA